MGAMGIYLAVVNLLPLRLWQREPLRKVASERAYRRSSLNAGCFGRILLRLMYLVVSPGTAGPGGGLAFHLRGSNGVVRP